MAQEIEYNENGTIKKRFGLSWYESGTVTKENIGRYVASTISSMKNQSEYVDILHDRIEELEKALKYISSAKEGGEIKFKTKTGEIIHLKQVVENLAKMADKQFK